ncbi:hypothetical protein BDZ91DRAFT_734962 [Kalaharituber pfeilii]|nr:hypothetical protein BDZ91DRAFT_734962 [Kalaharituber pfeilii]
MSCSQVSVRSSDTNNPTVFNTSTANVMASGHGSASHPKRDPDLLIPDDILTDTHFDNLWDWFASALETNMDRQFVFAKLVNSVRKPYLNRLNLTGNMFLPRTCTSYTPSECTITHSDHAPPGESQLHENETLQDLNSQIQGLKDQLRQAHADLTNKGNEIQLLETKLQTAAPSSAPVGKLDVQQLIRTHEILELEYYPDGMVAFKSTCFQNVYLRATSNPWYLSPGDRRTGGGALVNCQYISEGPGCCSIQEKFRIHPLGLQGLVAIEPAALPGRYLSLDAEEKTVTLQGVRGQQEISISYV